jgi:hypothetical protein
LAYNLQATLRLNNEFTPQINQAINAINRLQAASNRMNRDMRSIGDIGERSFNRTRNSVAGMSSQVSHLRSSVSATGAASAQAFGSMSAAASSVLSPLNSIIATVGAATLAYKTFQSTIGEAAKYEQSKIMIEAMIDDKSVSDQYMKLVDSFAAKSPVLNTQDMYASSKSFLTNSKDVKELEKMWNLTERMVAVDPAQGVDGAVLALRELFGGDSMSMVERFEMPRSELNKIKKLPLEQQLEALDKLFNKLNMTDKLVKSMGDSSLGIINRIKESLATNLRDVGMGALLKIKPALLDIEKAMSGKKVEAVLKAMGRGFSTMGDELIDFVNYVKTNWPTIESNFKSLQSDLAPVGEVLKAIYTAGKSALKFLTENFIAVKEAVIALTTAMIAFRAVFAIAAIIQTVTTALALYRAGATLAALATLGLNAAFLTSPLTWLAAGIAAVVAVGVLLYRNFDLVKQKASELWAGLISLKDQAVKSLTTDFGVFSTALSVVFSWLSKGAEYVGKFKDWLIQLGVQGIDFLQTKFEAFKGWLADHDTALRNAGLVITAIYLPALLQLAATALMTGASLALNLTMSIVRMGAAAVMSAGSIAISLIASIARLAVTGAMTSATLVASLIMSIVRLGTTAVMTASSIAVSLIGSLVRLAASALTTAATFTASLIAAMLRYIATGASVVIATTAQTVAMAAMRVGMIAATAAMGAMRLAQLALNVAIRLSPYGWVIALIGLLISAGIALYNNWGTIKAGAMSLWSKIREVWSSVASKTQSAWSSVKTAIGSAMDSAKSKVSGFFAPLLAFIANAKRKWDELVSALKNFKMPKLNIPSASDIKSQISGAANSAFSNIKAKVSGSHYHGLERVPRDGYVARLHKNERVLTAKEAKAYDGGGSSGSGVTINFNGTVVREEADINKITSQIVRALVEAEGGGV